MHPFPRVTGGVTLLMAALVLGNAFADPPEPIGSGQMDMRRKGGGPGIGDFSDAALVDDLKQRLVITPTQEKAWIAYATSLRQAAAALRQIAAPALPMSEQDRQARQQKAVDAVRQAAENLLPSLDEGQRAEARQILPGFAMQ